MYLSIIVPIYNEEKNLLTNIGKYLKYLESQSYDFEIILVNDGSIDNTPDIAREISEKKSNIKFINNKINNGKGAAVCEGLLAACGDFRLFIDADGATSIDHLEKIWKPFQEGADIVIGSRNSRDVAGAIQIKKQVIWKRALGICGNRLIQFFSVKNIYDTQCGFKAFTKEAVEKIIPKITIKRWGFDIEILSIAQLYNYKIKIIPVTWRNSDKSRVGVSGYFSTIKDLIQIKINTLKHKY